jgi:hypothetical protein
MSRRILKMEHRQMNIIEKIAAANYRPTDGDVEALAFAASLGLSSKGTYLRVLAAHVIDANPSKRGQLAAVKRAHEHFYPIVLRGVGGMSLDSKERERRGTFARTSTSTLRSFVKHGGDVRSLDLSTLTKSALRKLTATGTEPADRAERSLVRSTGQFVRAAKRLAKREPERAREVLQAAIASLREVMPGKSAKPVQRIVRATSHGAQPTAH